MTSKGIEGVGFTAYPITSLDLSSNDSWTTLAGLSVPSTACTAGANGGPALAGQTLGTGLTADKTDASGLTTLSKLPLAAYLVCETSAPSTVVDKASPFVVTVPYPDKANTKGWLYDVNVYPKNGVASISKSITAQTDFGLGSTVSFPVTTDVPALGSDESFTHYWVTDPLDSRLANAKVASVTVGGTAVDPSYYATSVANNYAWVSFTQAGLEWLATQSGKQIVTTFSGTVSTLGNGVINNTAYLNVNTQHSGTPGSPTTPPATPENPPTTPPTTPPGTPSNEVTDNWGDLVISKVDSGDSKSALSGAQFEVYASSTPNAASCTSTTTSGSAIAVNGETKFTTGSDGKVDVAGLFVSDSVNAPINAAQRCYVIKEVTAPTGYVLPSNALTAVTVKTGVTSGADVTVENTKQNVPSLPLTGGNGEIALTTGGTGLLLLAGVAALVARKRRNQVAA